MESSRIGLQGARIALGVSGGIAAYKAAELVSTLVQRGAVISVLLTRGGARFVTPVTFAGLTRRPVFTDTFDGWTHGDAGHVTLAREADVLVIAPGSANTIARLAQGRVEDMLSAVALATQAPIVVAPAMEHRMWHHPATQANVALLRERGVVIAEPGTGYLASGADGDGRLADLPTLIGTIRQVLGRTGMLRGKRIVVTAGGTREPLDPVRFLGNGSTGKMGIALAGAAVDAGADVDLIATASVGDLPRGMNVLRVERAADLAEAVKRCTKSADVLIMAAAVADYRPTRFSPDKIKKSADLDTLAIEFVRNPDILAGVTRPGLIKIGFAAETHDLTANARAKLAAKGLALIVANDAAATIGSDRSQATLLFADGTEIAYASQPKGALAVAIVEHVARLVAERDGDA